MSNGLRCAIALGSNLGDSRAILEDAIQRLQQVPGIHVAQRSTWYRTKPIGPPQPDYLNGCAIIQTLLSPPLLMQTLLNIEGEFGRVRGVKNGPRTLDLDFLWAEDQILDTPALQLPHPRMAERAFVLVPLAEIAPEWVHPILGKAIADLLKTVDCSDVQPLSPACPKFQHPGK
jgi:2-amino-4-hydroxy-6-hydroxymethyldihydropteridine diphosphokinase